MHVISEAVVFNPQIIKIFIGEKRLHFV